MEISYHDLQFEQIPITMRSSGGTKYRRWVDIGMPKIPRTMIQHVFYLYKTKEDAEKGSEYGGTGFFVAVPSEAEDLKDRVNHLYGITNWHVALNDGFSVVRINKESDETDILEYEPTDWEWISGKDDIAAVEIPYSASHLVNYVSTRAFATEKIVTEREIGVGDDVFMIGRFIEKDGGPTNLPSVRFGNISIMPSIIEQATKYQGESYCIDLYSLPGYSGSPVFVYRTPFSNLDAAFLKNGFKFDDSFIYLLGIHWGQFKSNIIIDGKHIKNLSGITMVIPAQKILDLLNIDKFRKRRMKEDVSARKRLFDGRFKPMPDSAKPLINTENPQHKEDFNSLVSAAAKKKPQDD
ncbi:MAG: serine protease [Desulfobaccales bacterium]